MLLDTWTWPYYYVEIVNENLKWKYTLVWILIVLISSFLISVLIRSIRILLSKYIKSKFELVEVLSVSESIMTGGEADKVLSNKSKVTVRFQTKKTRRKQIMFMDSKGIHEGDVGILEYKGDYGISFVKRESKVAEKENIYYKFKFKQNNKKERVRKERKVRKYW